MARKFLYLIALCILAYLGGRLALQFYPEQLTRLAFEPKGAFEAQAAMPVGRYAQEGMWFARPGHEGELARWAPSGAPARPAPVKAAVFFVHPTSYLARDHWNGPLDDADSRDRAVLLVRGLASPFAGADQLWVPRYRQAAFGAFLSDAPAAGEALDVAYSDIVQAFDTFLANVPADEPIVLVGHSQGAYHLRRLMADRVAGKPLAHRIAAAYLVGWPLSLDHDLPRMGLPPCTGAAEAGCVMSWLSFGEPGDPTMMVNAYARHRGLDGQLLTGSAFLCSNPLTGAAGGSAPAAANLGALVPDLRFESASLKASFTGARCRPDGALSLDGEPDIGPLVLPGNNYHVYDIPLFWANIRADYARRVTAWQAAH